MTIVNITTDTDTDFYRVFQYVVVAGDPIDITGATMEMMLRRHKEDVAAVLRLGTDTGEIVVVDPPEGKFTILIRKETLERLALGDYDHSNIMTFNGIRVCLWSGTFTNNAGPTR